MIRFWPPVANNFAKNTFSLQFGKCALNEQEIYFWTTQHNKICNYFRKWWFPIRIPHQI